MKRILLLIITTLTLCCCTNDNDKPTNPVSQLPPETQNGANTFGFLINGEPVNVTNTSNQTAIYQGGLLQLGAGGIGIDISNISANIEYDLVGINLDGRARYQVDSNPQLGCQYDFEDTNQGNITFTKIDTVNYILSGIFEFSTVTDNCQDVKITNGRFDMQYIP